MPPSASVASQMRTVHTASQREPRSNLDRTSRPGSRAQEGARAMADARARLSDSHARQLCLQCCSTPLDRTQTRYPCASEPATRICARINGVYCLHEMCSHLYVDPGTSGPVLVRVCRLCEHAEVHVDGVWRDFDAYFRASFGRGAGDRAADARFPQTVVQPQANAQSPRS